jgi:hypothetical protein
MKFPMTREEKCDLLIQVIGTNGKWSYKTDDLLKVVRF